MSCLHIINQAPSNQSCWTDCLNNCSNDDAIIAIENGVYALLQPIKAASTVNVFALEADVQARGLSESIDHNMIINDAQFVELCTHYNRTVSWF